MSGSDSQQTGCSCSMTKCVQGNCKCFKAKSLCSEGCKCKDCRNTENKKVEVETRHEGYSKQTTPTVAKHPTVPPEGSPVPPNFRGCECLRNKCTHGKCACLKRGHGCTLKCKCQDCANPKGHNGSGTNTDPRQGGMGGVNNVPDDDTRSIVGELAQMEEHPTQSTDNMGSDPSKRPRLE